MEAVIFCGVQGAGKTTFYAERFLKTHIRISLDLLKTRNKERIFLQACFATGQRFVLDNTNPTLKDRQGYIEAARKNRFGVTGYLFEVGVEEALRRNKGRTGKEIVPDAGVRATFKKLQPLRFDEGFDRIYVVRLGTGFEVEEITPVEEESEPGNGSGA